MAEQAQHKNEKVILCTHNNSGIPQLGVYIVQIMHKGIQKPCRLFIILGEGPVLLGMPDVQTFELLSVNYNTIGQNSKNRQTNEQRTQGESNTKI